MSPISIVLIGFAMSTDAFAAAVGKGAAMRKPRLIDALRAGLIFGVIEAITPIIGWLLGRAASQYVQAFDHWIAFGLLGVLGAHMIIAGLKPDGESEADNDDEAGEQHKSFWTLAVTGFATSIDAMAIGVGLAFLDVHIGVVALVIGLCTMIMVTIGIMLGRALGAVVGKRAEIVGGVILIIIGCAILYEHLTAAAAAVGAA
ncbi:manganese efflux pump MntP family protein [uncultured Stenotrophomonas sp.]|uniref:manganese efflux pump MntP n=1 Tax=uncultured Stenotrophomonas sp. TaxID=165438 RepID=UPI0025E4D00D|nr:manganese efflux pump MntP family protein [uncultured Stenotrophomonas sp.]